MAWYGHYKWHSPTLQTTELEHQIDVYRELLNHISGDEKEQCKKWLKQARIVYQAIPSTIPNTMKRGERCVQSVTSTVERYRLLNWKSSPT